MRHATAHAPHKEEWEDLMKKSGSRFPARAGVRGTLTLLLILPIVAVLQACDLDENPVSVITPDNFYQNEQEIIGGLAASYSRLRGTMWTYFNLSEISSDEMVVPTRGQDWFDNGRWLEIHQQAWSANSPSGLDDINGAWNDNMGGVANTNIVLSALENVNVADQEIYIAELRALRAWYYYLLMDFFGGVPLATDPQVTPRPRTTRAELFNFIEEELLAARTVLPASWPPEMDGRMTSGACDAILASLYLNAEVWTGTVSTGGLQRGQARWQDAIDAADRVINSGVYSLEADWFSNFTPDNYLSSELIFVVKHLNQSGLGQSLPFRVLHYNQLDPTPWNGFSTIAETFNQFDPDDLRTDIFLVGQQVNLDTGEEVNDRQGNPLIFTPEIGAIVQASENEGVRILKYPPDPARFSDHNGNDYAYFRLAEMYLIKAEALNELGSTGAAIDILNMLRERVFDPDKPIDSAGLSQAAARDRILQERLFELTAEGKRRMDLIRHDKFTLEWQFKPQTDPYRILFPIPQTQLDTNPELVQNPGY
jgi:hypothetical protein